MSKYFFIFICLLFSNVHAHRLGNRSIVLINPSGHAGDVGRLLVDGYERAQTQKFAQALKDELLKKYGVCSFPYVSHAAGEEVLPLQIPSFSNRLGSNFFLRVQMYREESEKPKLFLYQLVFNHIVDFASHDISDLSLTPLHQAHFKNIYKSEFYGQKIYEYLKDSRYFDCYPLKGLPLKPLIGITAPAILLEIGICQENLWKSLVKPIVESLHFLF